MADEKYTGPGIGFDLSPGVADVYIMQVDRNARQDPFGIRSGDNTDALLAEIAQTSPNLSRCLNAQLEKVVGQRCYPEQKLVKEGIAIFYEILKRQAETEDLEADMPGRLR